MMQMVKSAESATSEMVKQQKRRGAPASIVPDEERQQVLSQEGKSLCQQLGPREKLVVFSNEIDSSSLSS